MGKADRREERRRRDALRGQFGRERFEALVQELVALHRLALEVGQIPSAFNLEGVLRHALRSDLALQGWRWIDADFAAREVLAVVYGRLRVERPSWDQGQREWTQHAGTLIERERCANCHGMIPPGNYKFCCRHCAKAFHDRLSDRRHAKEETVRRMASRWI